LGRGGSPVGRGKPQLSSQPVCVVGSFQVNFFFVQQTWDGKFLVFFSRGVPRFYFRAGPFFFLKLLLGDFCKLPRRGGGFVTGHHLSTHQTHLFPEGGGDVGFFHVFGVLGGYGFFCGPPVSLLGAPPMFTHGG